MLELRETADHPLNSSLGAVNQFFHKEYQRWLDKAAHLVRTGQIPILIRLDNRLVLVDGEQQREYAINGNRFHELKALCHLPLAVYLILAGNNEDRRDLRDVLANLYQFPASVDDLKEKTELLKSAVTQLADSIVVNNKILSHEATKKFARQLKPIFNQLVTDAAVDEVAQLMEVTSSIKAKVGDAQKWSRAYFVVCAGHQPRYKQITKKFFERWLLEESHSKLESVHRVIYAEGRSSLEEVLQLVCTRMVSADLGEVFLHSPLSLDEDVLGDAGLAAINKIFQNGCLQPEKI